MPLVIRKKIKTLGKEDKFGKLISSFIVSGYKYFMGTISKNIFAGIPKKNSGMILEKGQRLIVRIRFLPNPMVVCKLVFKPGLKF